MIVVVPPWSAGAADHRRRVGQLVLGAPRYDNRPAAMDMRVDPARDHDLPHGVDHPPRADRSEAASQNGETARDHDIQHMSLSMMVITPPP
jgi:hypothetical protein